MLSLSKHPALGAFLDRLRTSGHHKRNPNSKWGPALLPAPTLRPLGLVLSRLASAFPRWSVIADVRAPCGLARRSALCAWRASGWMPSGARSPWAAADPCFRTRSRRYPSFRLSASVECQALLRRSGLPRLFRALFQAVRKKPSVGVSPLSGCSLPTWLSPGRTNAAVRRGEMLSAILVFAASRWMETEACPRAAPWKTMPFRTPFTITKAAVLHIRKQPGGTCRLVTLQTIRGRIALHLVL